MYSLEIDCDPEDRELLIAELWEQGSAGMAELSASRVRAFFDDEVDRAGLLERYPGAITRVEEERDWVQSARDLLQPMNVGHRFFLAPEWRDDPAPEGRFRITVNPGMAFGTGVHETTQLCLEALEEFVTPGTTMFDVGSGSGILAEAARLLGAGRIYACDIDPDAVRIAGHGFIGSADAVRGDLADVITANISPEAIIQLAPELSRVLRSKGVLLASGFEIREVEMVRAALPPGELRTKGNWALLAVRRGPTG
jgi:ribosomal protein L11 methyltransferase